MRGNELQEQIAREGYIDGVAKPGRCSTGMTIAFQASTTYRSLDGQVLRENLLSRWWSDPPQPLIWRLPSNGASGADRGEFYCMPTGAACLAVGRAVCV